MNRKRARLQRASMLRRQTTIWKNESEINLPGGASGPSDPPLPFNNIPPAWPPGPRGMYFVEKRPGLGIVGARSVSAGKSALRKNREFHGRRAPRRAVKTRSLERTEASGNCLELLVCVGGEAFLSSAWRSVCLGALEIRRESTE